ncbi:MAG: hypothetical protein QM786_15545 [Breznakibacter sp.]
MNGYITIFETGMQYAQSAESLARGSRFLPSMALNMIGLATECLLGSVVEKYDLYVPHVSVGTLGQALAKAGRFPEALQPHLKLLSLGCAVCSVSGDDAKFAPNIDKLLNAFAHIKDWVATEMIEKAPA